MEHDSLQISNGKWYWHSKGIGGHTAVQFLMKVREMRYPDAIRQVLRYTPQAICLSKIHLKRWEKVFQPPKRNYNHNRVIAYLEKRGISRNVISIASSNRSYTSPRIITVLCLSERRTRRPKYGNIRSTNGSFKGGAEDLTNGMRFLYIRLHSKAIRFMCLKRQLMH